MGYVKSLLTPSELVTDMNAFTLAKVDALTQSADISSTPLYTVPTGASAKVFQVSAELVIATAGSASSTLPPLSVTYTDAETGNSITQAITASSTANTTATAKSGVVAINVAAGGAITFSTSGYAASSANSMVFNAKVRINAV